MTNRRAHTSATLLGATALLIMFSGCSDAQPTRAAKAAPMQPDPVAAFEDIAAEFIPAFNELYKEKQMPPLIKKVSVFTRGAKYDVKHSESLVTPYMGEIHATGSLETEHLGTCVGTYSFYFAFQDDQWSPRGGEFSGTTDVGSPANNVFKVTPDSMKEAMVKARVE